MKKVALLDLFGKSMGVSPFFFFFNELHADSEGCLKKKNLSCLGRLWGKPDSRQEIPEATLLKKGGQNVLQVWIHKELMNNGTLGLRHY